MLCWLVLTVLTWLRKYLSLLWELCWCMILVLTVLMLLTKRPKFWDKDLAGDESVDGCCFMLLVLTLQTKRDKSWDKEGVRADNDDRCCCMLLLRWLVLTDVDESLFSRILVYFVVKISTHLDLGYATGAHIQENRQFSWNVKVFWKSQLWFDLYLKKKKIFYFNQRNKELGGSPRGG